MKKYNSSFLLALMLNGTVCGQSYLASIYSAVLGSVDLKPTYQQQIRGALRELGVRNHETVAIKKMNMVGPLVAGTQLSSFTAAGIWFDEDWLDQCTNEERVFQIYHEAAHYARRHHQKLIGTSIVAGGVTALGGVWAKSQLGDAIDFNLYAVGMLACAAGACLGVVPLTVRGQEKEADIVGAKYLAQTSRKAVVEEHIRKLGGYNSQDSGFWWDTPRDQVAYLNEALKPEIKTAF